MGFVLVPASFFFFFYLLLSNMLYYSLWFRLKMDDSWALPFNPDGFQDFVFEVNPQNGQTVTAGGLEEVTLFMCYEMHFFFLLC